MKTIRIAFGDVRHETVGAHSTYAPVAIGYIATYLQSQISDVEFDIRLYTRPDELLDDIDKWSPQVVAMSNYLWNSSLSNRICEYAKETIGNVLCILGGPEFPSGTGQSDLTLNADLCLDYLLERPAVDYYCYSDGETAVAALVRAFIDAGCNVEKLKGAKTAIDGCVVADPAAGELIIGNAQPRIGLGIKGHGRDVVPSPYTSGIMDKFLNGNFIPSLETQRGCPFFCTFCDQGMDSTKMVTFSVARICEELTYIAEKVGQLKAAKSLAFHDSNFGMYARDREISEHLRTLMDKYDWPKNIEISTPKNRKERILEIDTILKNRVAVSLSQQSMNRDTLKEIKRDNYTNAEYLEFVRELETRGKAPGCELIIPLPGETEQTFHESVRLLADNGLLIGVYTLMMLRGNELGRRSSRKTHGMKTKFRVLPRQFGEYRGKRIFEAEEVCIETNSMPFEAYCRSRRFSIIIELFSLQMFDVLRRHVFELGVSYYDFLKLMHSHLEDDSVNSPVHELYRGFSFESEAELLPSREALWSNFDDDENYKKLVAGELGDNLLRKYSTKMILHNLAPLVDLCYELIAEHLGDRLPPESKSAIDDVKSWILNRSFISDLLNNDFDETSPHKEVAFSFDVPQWYQSRDKEISDFRADVKYQFTSGFEDMKDELSGLFGDSVEFQVGKMIHTRPISVFFCDYSRV